MRKSESYIQGLRKEAARAVENGAPQHEVAQHVDRELQKLGNARFRDEWRKEQARKGGTRVELLFAFVLFLAAFGCSIQPPTVKDRIVGAAKAVATAEGQEAIAKAAKDPADPSAWITIAALILGGAGIVVGGGVVAKKVSK